MLGCTGACEAVIPPASVRIAQSSPTLSTSMSVLTKTYLFSRRTAFVDTMQCRQSPTVQDMFLGLATIIASLQPQTRPRRPSASTLLHPEATALSLSRRTRCFCFFVRPAAHGGLLGLALGLLGVVSSSPTKAFFSLIHCRGRRSLRPTANSSVIVAPPKMQFS